MQALNIQDEIKSPRVKSVCFHRSRPVVLLALHNGEIRAYDYTLSSFIHKFLDHDGPVRSIQFHPQNDIFVSGGDDQYVRIWDYASRTNVKLKGHTDYIRCVRFHQNEPFLLSASDDRTVKIWNFQSKKKIRTLAGHTNYVMCAEFLHDKRVVSVSLDQTIRVWNIDDGTSEIVEAHDKGINALSLLFNNGSFAIFTGSDDRSIKMFNSDLVSTDSFNYHSKAVTALLTFNKVVISCGEDGLLFVNENKKTRRIEREGRFWCLARNSENVIVAGHDESFVIFKLKNDLVFDENYVIRDSRVVNYRNERVVDLKKEAKSICSQGDMLIVNYAHRFEVYKARDQRLCWSETGNAAFFNDLIVCSNKGEFHTYLLNGQVKDECIFFLAGRVVGFKTAFFVLNEKKIVMVNAKYERKSTSVPFVVTNVYYSEKPEPVCVVTGRNDLAILDNELEIVRHTNDMTRILSVVISDGLVFYTTEKQLRYVFRYSEGVICSLNSFYLARMYKKDERDMCLLVNDAQTVEREVNLDEIKFKLAVLNNDSDAIASHIGNLPGMAVVNFLRINGRGDIALPFIHERAQKFKLYLSMGDIANAYEIANDPDEYAQIYQAGMKNVELIDKNYEVIEGCVQRMKDERKLFMFYLVTGNDEKLRAMVADDLNVRLLRCVYLDDKNGVMEMLRDGGNIVDNQKMIEDELAEESDGDEDKYYDYDGENKLYHVQRLNERRNFVVEGLNAEKEFDSAMACIDAGKAKDALKTLYTIFYSLADSLDEKKRFLIGRYVAGLESERKRKKETDVKRMLERAHFFYHLELLPKHRKIQTENYVAVSYKNGNYTSAKLAAEQLDDEFGMKVRKSKHEGDAIEVGKGVFCVDEGCYRDKGRRCSFCGCFNAEGECGGCYIGVVSDEVYD
ncbi:Vesicle coat complex COPI, alpha subunit [Trachipleistophora hominis]|uniref:Vesicle coat complex COPI, alpha subunit n=1 Tax=Trachipleistophora hominis TaxID=72359 RepID=L7JVC9_TRAHO|nr:Vesicle coat complex COPI, alpha subunit [Trachipleistophora hominis]